MLIKMKMEKRKIEERGRETPKLKEFASTVSNSERSANWMSILVRPANWVSNSKISRLGPTEKVAILGSKRLCFAKFTIAEYMQICAT